MSEDDITIMQLPTVPRSRLYYYQGNFYHPLDLPGACVGLVKRGIREFMKANRAMVERDRAHPDYKSLVQLFDEQMAEFAAKDSV